jgi:hypothetical protein
LARRRNDAGHVACVQAGQQPGAAEQDHGPSITV